MTVNANSAWYYKIYFQAGVLFLFTSWYDVSHAMGFRGWGEIQLKITHSLTHFVRQLIYALNLD